MMPDIELLFEIPREEKFGELSNTVALSLARHA